MKGRGLREQYLIVFLERGGGGGFYRPMLSFKKIKKKLYFCQEWFTGFFNSNDIDNWF